MHPNSRLLFAKYAIPRLREAQRVLEVGPDDIPSTYQRMAARDGLEWHTLDIGDSAGLTYPKSAPYSFPVPDGEYDVALSGQVIEHVPKAWLWMREVARVTRQQGLVITIAPASWPYHEAPIDCWRLFPEALRALSEEAGLVIEHVSCESLELPRFQSAIPGRSPEMQPRPVRAAFRVLGAFGLPVEKSFDTICVARKP
jgi:hypothetical protein